MNSIISTQQATALPAPSRLLQFIHAVVDALLDLAGSCHNRRHGFELAVVPVFSGAVGGIMMMQEYHSHQQNGLERNGRAVESRVDANEKLYKKQ